jgi:phage shock protein A
MPGALKRSWTYLGTKARSPLGGPADPKVLLEQAILEAEDEHRRLVEQAVGVFADHVSAESSLDRATDELDKVQRLTTQSGLQADDAARRGVATKVAELTAATESFASRLAAIEVEVTSLQELALRSAQDADDVKAELQQRANELRDRVTEHEELLLSPIDRTAMQVRVSEALASLSEPVGQDIPSVDELRDKISARSSRAQGPS